jgi:uncharacterized iron-regulated protein
MTRRLMSLLATLILTSACASVPEPPKLRDARYVLLGEVHDNPRHHAERAALLRELLADGRPTRVVFEQMARDRAAAIAAAPRDADAVADAGALDRRGWRWPLHRPVVKAAIDGSATIVGGNLTRDEVRAIVREGLPAVPTELGTRLDGWSTAQEATLDAAIDAGHCGQLPPERRPALALAQRARDAAMAQAMLAAPPGERVVLIAGNGHVREDLGVPHYLRAAGVAPERIITIAWVEDGDDEPGGFDLVRRTPRIEREDPCAALHPSRPAAASAALAPALQASPGGAHGEDRRRGDGTERDEIQQHAHPQPPPSASATRYVMSDAAKASAKR